MQLTVRETFEFAARCQGVGLKAANLERLLQMEQEKNITPDPAVDTYMKADALSGNKHSVTAEVRSLNTLRHVSSVSKPLRRLSLHTDGSPFLLSMCVVHPPALGARHLCRHHCGQQPNARHQRRPTQACDNGRDDCGVRNDCWGGFGL